MWDWPSVWLFNGCEIKMRIKNSDIILVLAALVGNILLALVCYAVCRIVFVIENWNILAVHLTKVDLGRVIAGSLLFDGAAIAYTNSLYVILMLLTLPSVQPKLRWWNGLVKFSYVIPNSLSVIANLCDSVYFPFTKQRTTSIVFDEFANENNLLTIFCIEAMRHWYLVLLATLLIFILWKFYRPIQNSERANVAFYISRLLVIVVMTALSLCAMRGKYTDFSSRPIAINDAHKYVSSPIMTAVVLNTPFAVLRTIGERPMTLPTYFADSATLDATYTPVHHPCAYAQPLRKNVVILIVESFAAEFVGALNRDLENGAYRGYTPFADSLLSVSLTWRESFANGGMSIDAMPAVLASIPRMDTPFVLQPYSLNKINAIATELKRLGYQSAFFHGAPNGSMGFEAFARLAGFDEYVGKTEYEADARFGGADDFDGTWAIWDEPFLQFFAHRMSDMREPFVTAVFTASSHHPFNVPEQYRDTFPEEGAFPIHKCIRYTDHSLRRFFDTASHQPWYNNTIFVLTADHASSRITHDEYKTEVGLFRVPILFFDPSGEMERGCREGIAQQIDIMPTLLSYLGYDRPFIAFGKDLLSTPVEDSWAFNWDHIPQYIQGDYTMLFDGTRVTGLYNYKDDPLLRHNIMGKCERQPQMESRIKAIMQSYMERMKSNNMTLK